MEGSSSSSLSSSQHFSYNPQISIPSSIPASSHSLFIFTNIALEQFLIMFEELQEEDQLMCNKTKEELRHLMMNKILNIPLEETSADINAEEENEIVENKQYDEAIDKQNTEYEPVIGDIDELVDEMNEIEYEKNMNEMMMNERESKTTKSVQQCKKITSISDFKINGETIELPYCPSIIDYGKRCQNIKINNSLYTPCGNEINASSGLSYCNACAKLVKNGKSEGTLKDREETKIGEFKSKRTGKNEISYATYLAKRGLTLMEINEMLEVMFDSDIQIPNTPEYTNLKKSIKKRVVSNTKLEVKENTKESKIKSIEEEQPQQVVKKEKKTVINKYFQTK